MPGLDRERREVLMSGSFSRALARVGVDRVDAARLRCRVCGSTWTAPLARRAPRGWWTCPSGCNAQCRNLSSPAYVLAADGRWQAQPEGGASETTAFRRAKPIARAALPEGRRNRENRF